MNNQAAFVIAAVVAVTLGSHAAENKELFKEGFDVANRDSVPEELMILSGQFFVKEIDGNKVLELPGNPLEDFGALFGPAESEGIAVRACIRSESTKRLAPRFGVGLGGVAGYRLLVTPSKNALQLLKDQEVVSTAPFQWTPASWTSLHLQVRKISESKWVIEGRAWANGTPEPKDWSISFEISETPLAGKASIWGAPYSGKPILFDDLSVISLQP
jgi:hypothetical protein